MHPHSMSDTIATTRMTVVDVAYGELVVAGRVPEPVGALVRGINASSVLIDGTRMHTTAAWSQVFARALTGIDAVTVAHPSTWGTRRTEILRTAAHTRCAEVVLTPRAAAIAESHLELSAQRALVIEAHARIDIHECERGHDGWTIVSTTVATAESIDSRLHELVDNRIEAILIDGEEGEVVADLRDRCEAQTVVGRVAVVQRALIHRFGGAALPVHNPEWTVPMPERRSTRRRIGVSIAAAVAIVVALAVAAAVIDDRSDGPASAADREVQLGRVAITVPTDWRESNEPPAEGIVSRTTFAAAGDDRRIIVLQNAVRNTSTLASVASSLRNRIDQRGDDVVQEFSASTRFAGREVISYREVPVSGGPIRWYLLVSAGLQVSVGCQDGSAGEAIGDHCRIAVGSVRVDGP
jgi:type VII secretion-associated protein (TIGR03931 family)